ncbi:MAG: histone deacetylase [Bacteroidetes bacterium]|nr:histone deacetylase [Bacteroidota bacterium]
MLRIAYSPLYKHPVPENHRFPMEKYEWIYHQLQLEGIANLGCFFEPEQLVKEFALKVHKEEYFDRFVQLKLTPKEQRQTGFQHDQQLIMRELVIAEGTRRAVDYALKDGIAFNIAGGTHHAFTNRGEGFCMLNDQAIAAAYFIEKFPDKKVLILDLDVHQGNGTAEIFKNNDSVFTFSMHGKSNYPIRKEYSDWDIALENDTQDELYLHFLSKSLEEFKKNHEFDLVFYQAGVDVLETDKLGKLKVSMEGVKKRDTLVLEYCHQSNIPAVVCMGGGYSQDTRLVLEAHMSLFRQAFLLFEH